MSGKSELRFIGVVESSDALLRVKIFPEFCVGLQLFTLQVVPRRHLGDPQVGVFACRSPSRPNLIGLCVVELKKIENCTLLVGGLDALEGSPIIDIKPYIPRADSIIDARVPEWVLHGLPT